MSEPSAAITGSTPKETGTEISSFVPSASRGLISVAPHPIFQPRIVLDTAREVLGQHLLSTSDVLPQVLGEYTASFNQPVPVPELATDNPYSVVPQPMSDGTQVHANSPIPEKGADADQTKSEPLRRHSRLRRSNRAVATIRNDRDDHTAISRQDLDLPCPLSALPNGMQHIPVRDMYAWVHRPVETRRQEALQRHGRIPRPTNPFILYRMEAPHIRKKYKMLAVMEKRNHAGAHPEYRFSLSNKENRSRTAKSRSPELEVYSMASSKPDQSSQPNAWSTPLDENRVSEHSTGHFPAEDGIVIKRNTFDVDGFGPPQCATSVWW
ncbi:hypothetical protein BDQ94DRAFT_164430 [Aspergillus welwitschiae]|uniref:HMG box domain-containing protein n=1 Tax=Aspergillus welwitschiae TaxID=1341132 RepID=A0A3F3PIF7_9EURO|nr:hypothetical protein BDQ94DRAFT_164430 [Aspergillus welwitschiae]RDH26512.1 hypothetical protein BDQ94DRAFT_164430 [Aspergillus welwitschiae]